MAHGTQNLDLEELARLGEANLARVVAIDSQSDEASSTIPSTEGQRRLAEHLEDFFRELGYKSERDPHANLMVDVPGEEPNAPRLALMVHLDTARGTEALPRLERRPNWDGSPIAWPANPRLEVSVARYPETRRFLGHDLLHGPGRRAFGLDDKLGLAELMTLAQVLARGGHRHGPLVLVGRPDEEIGRMAAVVGLASELARRGVSHGYTVDGIDPFEVNVENFNASRATVRIAGRPFTLASGLRARRLDLVVRGAKSHGATAKAEGYRNATVLFARALAPFATGGEVLPVVFRSDIGAETDAEIALVLCSADDAGLASVEARVLAAVETEVAPHRFKGADIEVVKRSEGIDVAALSDEAAVLLRQLGAFLASKGPEPKLSEDSAGRQGYSNPCMVYHEGHEIRLEYRLRDFEPAALAAREDEVRAVAAGDGLAVEVQAQYVNMGPRLAPHPELVRWASDAAARAGEEAVMQPIRGGTGVDPFLDVGIPVANLGTGYFAPESEKEMTSRQLIARHVRWLVELVARVAEGD